MLRCLTLKDIIVKIDTSVEEQQIPMYFHLYKLIHRKPQTYHTILQPHCFCATNATYPCWLFTSKRHWRSWKNTKLSCWYICQHQPFYTEAYSKSSELQPYKPHESLFDRQSVINVVTSNDVDFCSDSDFSDNMSISLHNSNIENEDPSYSASNHQKQYGLNTSTPTSHQRVLTSSHSPDIIDSRPAPVVKESVK